MTRLGRPAAIFATFLLFLENRGGVFKHALANMAKSETSGRYSSWPCFPLPLVRFPAAPDGAPLT